MKNLLVFKLSLLIPVSIVIINTILNIYKLDKNCIQYKLLNGIRIVFYIFIAIICASIAHEIGGLETIILIAILGVVSLLISSISVFIINLIYKTVKKENITENILHTILYTAILIFSFLYIYIPIYFDAQIGVI